MKPRARAGPARLREPSADAARYDEVAAARYAPCGGRVPLPGGALFERALLALELYADLVAIWVVRPPAEAVRGPSDEPSASLAYPIAFDALGVLPAHARAPGRQAGTRLTAAEAEAR